MSTVQPRQRGVALLLALVALVMLSSAGVTLLRRVQSAYTSTRLSHLELQARILAMDLREPLLEWLERCGLRGPQATPTTENGWVILDHTNDQIRVTVNAIDLSGHLHVSKIDATVSSGLPSEMQNVVDSSCWRRWLDESRRARLNGTPIAPRPVVESALREGINDKTTATTARTNWLTTLGTGALNVRTAPLPFLEAALSLQGNTSEDIRRIMQARRTGTELPSDEVSRVLDRHNGSSDDVINLTSESSAWGFDIVIADQGRIQRWWIAAERSNIQSTQRSRRPQRDWTIVECRRVAP